MENWLPILGTLIGAMSAVLGGWLQHHWSLTRNNNSDLSKMQLEHTLREREFEKTTLVGLQDAAGELIRNATHGYLQDAEHVNSGGNWGGNQRVESGNEELRKSIQLFLRLETRLLNDGLREKASSFRIICSELSIQKTKEEADLLRAKIGAEYSILNEGLGARLRELYALRI